MRKSIMTSLAIGDHVSFSYLKGAEKEGYAPKLVNYASRAANYAGTVEDVRDITKSPLSFETVAYGKIKGERSQNLVTVSIDGDGSKAFYDGRMVNVQRQEK
jgi:hypothetical protein